MKLATFVMASALGLATVLNPVLAKPQPAMPAGPAKLTELVTFDQQVGKGKLVGANSTVTVHYSGWLYAPKAPKQRGSLFDTSTGDKPLVFKMGAGTVIKGLEEGVRGMRVGGKRTLLIPASMGFGKDGLGPVPATANMIFDVEVIDVK